ncbi:MAG: hypothetical protein ACOYZ8_06875 [Chloroflexota bacterium]
MAEQKIRHPYANTPYDIFSFPDIPELGIFTPESRQNDVIKRRAEITKRRLLPPLVVAETARALGYPHRIEVDVFLRSTLSQSKEIEELIAKAEQPPSAPLIEVDWTAGLPYWIESPISADVKLQDVKLIKLTAYDDPRTDLLAVGFDS